MHLPEELPIIIDTQYVRSYKVYDCIFTEEILVIFYSPFKKKKKKKERKKTVFICKIVEHKNENLQCSQQYE